VCRANGCCRPLPTMMSSSVKANASNHDVGLASSVEGANVVLGPGSWRSSPLWQVLSACCFLRWVLSGWVSSRDRGTRGEVAGTNGLEVRQVLAKSGSMEISIELVSSKPG
jgi:hypothetical protein